MDAKRNAASLILCFCIAGGTLRGGSQIAPARPTVSGSMLTVGHYVNDFFGFSLHFPESWAVNTKEFRTALEKDGGEPLIREGILRPEQVEVDQHNTRTLLSITNLGDSANGYAASIQISAEGVHQGAPFNSAQGYLAHTASLFLKMRTPRYTFIEKGHEVLLGGTSFTRAEFRGEFPNLLLSQYFYAQLRKGYALSIVVSAADKKQLARTDAVLRGLQFTAAD